MDTCPIQYYTRVTGPLDDDQYHIKPIMSGRDMGCVYERRWCWFFRAIESGLPELHHFRFGAPTYRDAFDHVRKLVPGLYDGMYMGF